MQDVTLTKSILMAYRQCPLRAWLQVHAPELANESESNHGLADAGVEVGKIARQIYDSEASGVLVDRTRCGPEEAISRTTHLLTRDTPIFEAGFSHDGLNTFVDVLLPSVGDKQKPWKLIEVKSSSSVKAHHHDDVAIQALVVNSSGVHLTSVAIAHVDSTWVYQGDGDYTGLLKELDVTESALSRGNEVLGWIRGLRSILQSERPPAVRTGKQCNTPHRCAFFNHCSGLEPRVATPASWLPKGGSRELSALLADNPMLDIYDVPDEALTEVQQRVKHATLSGTCYLDTAGARHALRELDSPTSFLDFETVMFAVPRWKGTRPYQQIPFQFSLHRTSGTELLEHIEHIDLSGEDPREGFAEALIFACGTKGPIYVYNESFERSRILELASWHKELSTPLLAIAHRLRDLLPVVRSHYYHPDQQGSWSIKRVLPTIAPELDYRRLKGVADGQAAMDAYVEATRSDTADARRHEIERQLREYCGLDTLGMHRIWAFLLAG